MNIDLELYRIFCEVVKYKNITKTAESLYITQSAITQSIQKLENILGGKLFYRNRNGVELTEEGINLYGYIKDSVEKMCNAENIFLNYLTLKTGRIRIGGGNSIITNLIYNPLKIFCDNYPDIDITISNGMTQGMLNKLLNGEVDVVAFDHEENEKLSNNIEVTHINKCTFVFAASKEYFKTKYVKSIDGLSNNRLIVPKLSSLRGKKLKSYCEKNNINLDKIHEVSSAAIVKNMILDNMGIGYININEIKNVEDKVDIIKVIEYENMYESVATLKPNMINKATLEFINQVKKFYNINKN